jgi:4-cresol dehydrogenase (hydroxylating)
MEDMHPPAGAVPPSAGKDRALGFLEELSERLGQERVLARATASEKYGANTSGVPRRIAGAVCARSTEDVVAVLRLAAKHGIPVYPISTGRNWGYGSASPVAEDCVILDLSEMNRVMALDREIGLVTVQPGVTQQILKDHLDERGLDFLVPVHGGGPGCSLVGNALERGYGITPIADHFAAVTSLTAVLPSGEVYRRALSSAGAEVADSTFKWGLGPYLDGLFTQSSLGVVTEMTIALARRPSRIEAFYFWVRNDAALEQTVVQVREVLRTYAGIVGSINLMSDRRILSMMIPFPRDRMPPGQIMPAEMVSELCRGRAVPAWMGIGAMYGDGKVVRAARSGIRRLLRTVSRRVLFLSRQQARRWRWLLGLLPGRLGASLSEALDMVIAGQAVFEGDPTEVALRLAYWKSGKPGASSSLDPARDGCGLIWYSPLVPMKPQLVRSYVQSVCTTCEQHGIEPLITLTSLSERCFDSTVPLLFDRGSERETENAHACYRALLSAGLRAGCFPYRVGVEHMPDIVDPRQPFWKLVGTLKDALDPQHILAPGRYSPTR